MSDICPECGNEFEVIGKHWSYSPSHRKEFSDGQMETLTGILMGDGYITERNHDSKNPRFQLSMINKTYLDYLNDVFGILTKGVRVEATAEQNAASNIRTGHRPDADAGNYHDLYNISTVSHPQISELSKWYESGEKVWPENITLTPRTLRGWYVSDGTWKNYGAQNYISFAASNERGNQTKINNYFKNVGLPLPNNYYTYETKEGYTNFNVSFSTENSKILWEYMRPSPPGFEYKWPDR